MAGHTRALPPFRLLWQHYPDTTPAEVLSLIFAGKHNYGWITSPIGITNTCVVRTSRAPNSAGDRVQRLGGLNTLIGNDNRHYAFRVREMIPYLESQYGPPDVVSRGTTQEHLAAVAGRRGIIAFQVSGWSDATGHIDIWNGQRARHAAYFDRAQEVLLWEAP